MSSKIIYTITDEAPALATHSFLPIVRAFVGTSGVEVETRDISLAARILAVFPDLLTEEQKVENSLAELGELAKTPEANIIKTPNISASMPQLKAAIAELQAAGYPLPHYPDEATNAQEADFKARYDSVKGSAVNPVIREGNSDRRAPKAVKEYARANPHSMGAWSADSKTTVATMTAHDFCANEVSITLPAANTFRIEHVATDGTVTVLKKDAPLLAGEILDATFMSQKALTAFLNAQIEEAKKLGILFSLHMKATMMKVSDPIIFGHCIRVFLADLLDKHGDKLAAVGFNPNDGIGALDGCLAKLSDDDRAAVEAALTSAYANGPGLAMVNSEKGITGLHVPSDVIIDASMPAMIRAGGLMWDKAGKEAETLAVIPDSSYAGIYQATIDFCKENGALDPKTMGTVPNVGLMAQQAEEYGSHDKTFEAPADGTIRTVDAAGNTLTEHTVAKGDIWRACQVKDAPVQDWIKLTVSRARATGSPAVFWLDANRAHDAQLIAKVNAYLPSHDTAGLDIHIMSPTEATKFTLARIVKGEDTISVTGNVLRDYLTDLFPILEVGTSAKMLSIVPLMNGGGLFETGAGGSAPKHVQQFLAENFLRWDSLGEFLALAVSLEHLAANFNNPAASVLGITLDDATTGYLLNNHSPSRSVGGIDNRGSHFYLALYWAKALAAQSDNADLAAKFAPVAAELEENTATILAELKGVQGSPVAIGGYFYPNAEAASTAMRPSKTFNQILAKIA